MAEIQIVDVTEDFERMDDVRALFTEYASEIGIDLGFQGFEQELAELPGCYEAPHGVILLAEANGQLAGCVALRPMEDRIAELKRMYVRPEYRGRGIALALVPRVLRDAFERGYSRVRLDTLASMTAARNLYESFGFTPIEPYYDNPLPDVCYFELDFLADARKVVAANLHETGSGRWALVVYDDDETTMDFVHMLLNTRVGLSAKVAAALMVITHLHGSAIVRRFEDRHEAEALSAVLKAFIIGSGFPLKLGVIEIKQGATP